MPRRVLGLYGAERLGLWEASECPNASPSCFPRAETCARRRSTVLMLPTERVAPSGLQLLCKLCRFAAACTYATLTCATLEAFSTKCAAPSNTTHDAADYGLRIVCVHACTTKYCRSDCKLTALLQVFASLMTQMWWRLEVVVTQWLQSLVTDTTRLD